MDPQMLMALAQMGQGFGAAAGTNNSSAWGDAFSPSVLGGYLKGRGAKKAKKKAQARFKRALSTTESIQGRGLQQQEALARQATAQELKGYDVARQEAARMGRESKQNALDRGTQLEASAAQNLTSRGLGSTTRGANLSRGIQSDTNRTIAGVNEGLAGLYGNLAQGRAGVEAQGTQNLAGILGQQTDLQSQLAQMRMLGGATLGSIGTFDPGAWTPGYSQNNSEAFGQLMGSMGGGGGMGGFGGQGGFGGFGGGQQGGMDPQMLQYLFGHGGTMASGGGYNYPGTYVGAPSGG